MFEIRIRRIGFLVGEVSTRLSIDTGVNTTSGVVMVVPSSRPACEMLSSHSSFARPSPGDFMLVLKVYRCTSRYVVPEPDQIRVVMLASFFCVKNAGASWFGHDVVES